MLLTWEHWSTSQQGPLSLIGANRGLQCWLGCPNHLHSCDSFVAFLGGLQKEPVEVSVFSSDYLMNDLQWGLLSQVFIVKLMGVQLSTPALSCCQENIFREHYLYPNRTLYI